MSVEANDVMPDVHPPVSKPKNLKAVLKGLFNAILLSVSAVTLLPYALTSQKAIIRADLERWRGVHHLTDKSWLYSMLYLIAHYPEFRSIYYYRIKKGNVLAYLFVPFLQLIFKGRSNLFIYCDDIGGGLYIQHGFATIIAAERLGENCWINQQVTIGYTENGRRPVLGNNVTVTAGAKVLGQITLHDNVVVGANAVVLKSVPPNCTVVGIPAQIVKRDGVRVREALSN